MEKYFFKNAFFFISSNKRREFAQNALKSMNAEKSGVLFLALIDLLAKGKTLDQMKKSYRKHIDDEFLEWYEKGKNLITDSKSSV